MDSQRSVVWLPDGRDLDVLVGGADSASALLLLNGSPTGVAASQSELAAAAAHGLRFVTYGRPGYAGASAQVSFSSSPGHQPGSW